jgi:hypothetical protein
MPDPAVSHAVTARQQKCKWRYVTSAALTARGETHPGRPTLRHAIVCCTHGITDDFCPQDRANAPYLARELLDNSNSLTGSAEDPPSGVFLAAYHPVALWSQPHSVNGLPQRPASAPHLVQRHASLWRVQRGNAATVSTTTASCARPKRCTTLHRLAQPRRLPTTTFGNR